MSNETMTIKFWGVRGSHPAPGADTVQFGGNTPCIEVRVGEHTIIFDAGTGIIPLGRDLLHRAAGKPLNLSVFFSHMHHDHTQGFPFFAPAFIPSTRLNIFGPHTFERDLQQVLAANMLPPFFPVTLNDMGAAKNIQSVSESQAIVLDSEGTRLVAANSAESRDPQAVTIRLLKSAAHPGGVLIYRVEYRGQSIVYATDTEGYANVDRRLANFARGADLLIHDAQYLDDHYLGQNGFRSTQGWGHSTAAMACDLAAVAGVKQLALFHHDPSYVDKTLLGIEQQAQTRFANTISTREGMEITLNAERVQTMPAAPGQSPRLSVQL
jgi:phosphoribosyl 1,2-cyclic phosphodiesterase